MAKNSNILGIDLGGTTIKYGLVTNRGRLLKSAETPTPKTKSKVVEKLAEIIIHHRPQISKIGFGIPGQLNLKTGATLPKSLASLPLANLPLLKILKKKFNLPMKMDNDANCFTLAEARLGAGKNCRLVVGLTLGTGVGGGLVIDKKIFHGRGIAGEFGHQFIDFKKAADLEDFVGARQLKLSAQDYQTLEKQGRQKEKRALKFWQKLGLTIGFGCLNIIHTLDPEIIIFGGKQTKAFKLFYPEMIKTINKYCLTSPPKIVKSNMIDKAGIIGAALLFKS